MIVVRQNKPMMMQSRTMAGNVMTCQPLVKKRIAPKDNRSRTSKETMVSVNRCLAEGLALPIGMRLSVQMRHQKDRDSLCHTDEKQIAALHC
jgi:hypothetical protein